MSTPTFLLVSVKRQRLFLMRGAKIIKRFVVSTSRRGVGNQEGSLKTPLGLHAIHRKIGGGKHPHTIFKDRRDTGRRWDGKTPIDNLILGRVLTLDGLEPGLNRGGNIDSRRRYIYIHGTSHLSRVGRPSSQGCVTLKPSDAVALFARVKEGDLVYITRS